MSLLDDVLRMFGTSRTQLKWRWQRYQERRKQRQEPRPKPPPVHRPDRVKKALRHLLPEGTALYTMLLMVACLAIYFVTLRASGEQGSLFKGPSGLAAIEAGSLIPQFVFGEAGGEHWRLVTSCFLHFGLIHLAFNMVSLMQLGSVFEERWGRQRFLLVYLLTGVAGMAFSAWWKYRSGVVANVAGASGAVFGLIGAGITSLMRRGKRGLGEMKERLVSWAVFGIILSFSGRVDLAAHLGGLVAGLLLGLVIADKDSPRRWIRWTWPLVVLEVALVAGVVWAFVLSQRWVNPWM